MNFLSSISSKVFILSINYFYQTAGLFNSYKEEFGNFVQCLHSDIKEVLDKDAAPYYQYQTIDKAQSDPSKTSIFDKSNIIKFEQPRQTIIESFKGNSEKNMHILRSLMAEFIKESELSILKLSYNQYMLQRQEKLQQIVGDIEMKEASFNKDPSELVMLDRLDFTNFSVFYEQYCDNSLIQEKLEQFDENIRKRCESYYSQNENTEKLTKELYRKLLLRYFYRIIFYVNDALQNKQENQQQLETNDSNTNLSNPIMEPQNTIVKKQEEEKIQQIEETKEESQTDHKGSWDIDEKFI